MAVPSTYWFNNGGTTSACVIIIDADTSSDAVERAEQAIAEHARRLASSEAVERLLDEWEKEEHYEPRDRSYTAVAPPATPQPRRLNLDRCPLHCSPTLRHDPGRHPRPPPMHAYPDHRLRR